jgi:hypothetical protein
MTLAQHFAAYSEWRARVSEIIGKFSGWLLDHELNDAQTDRRIARLLEKLREDRLQVAFVAEFSRGKSELINAIFFAGYGNRILPSTAGRTTMCPTELMFDRSKVPSIELLPIETREANASISEYKRFADEWEIVPIDTTSAEAMQEALRTSVTSSGYRRRSPRSSVSRADGDSSCCGVGDGRLCRDSPLAPCNHQFPASAAAAGAGHPRHARPQRHRHRTRTDPVAVAQRACRAVHPGRRYRGHAVRPGGLARAHRLGRGPQQGSPRRSQQDRQPVGRAQVGAGGRRRDYRAGRTCAWTLDLPEDQIFPVSAQKALVAKINDDGELLNAAACRNSSTALSRN